MYGSACTAVKQVASAHPHMLLLFCDLQLAALRQQIASLRAENLALRVALGGDKEAAAAIAAAGRGSQVWGLGCSCALHAEL